MYFKPPKLKAQQINKRIEMAVKGLKALCKKEKQTLYCDGTDEKGRMVYRIKEVPSFTAYVNHPVLEF